MGHRGWPRLPQGTIMFNPIFYITDHHYIYIHVHVKSQCSLLDHDCILYRKKCIQDSVKLQEDLHSLENWAAK